MQHSPATFAFAAFCCLVVAAAPARAESVEQQVTRLNQRAMGDYDSLEFEAARRKLLAALQLLSANRLDHSALAAKTRANLGVVYINGLKSRDSGVQQFVELLKIQPDYRLDPNVDTPELAEAFAAAKAQLGISNAPTAATLQHTPIEGSRPGVPIAVRAQLEGGSGAHVALWVRGSGYPDFVEVPMRPSGDGTWVGVIPAEATAGSAVQYYLEARDADGRVLASSGAASSPHVIELARAAPPGTAVTDREDPLRRLRLARRQAARTGYDHFFIFLMPGFGFGVEPAGNHTEVAWQYQAQTMKYRPQPVGQSGIALAPFHLTAEVGYLLTPRWSLSLLGRFQLVTGANAETLRIGSENAATSKAGGAVAGLVRARYRFLSGRFHPYIHLDLGGGEIRHALDVSAAESMDHPLVDRYTAERFNRGDTMLSSYQQEVCRDHQHCVDTIALGYFLVGGGAGFWYDFASHFAVIFDVNLLGAVGGGSAQPGFNVDVQAGLGAHFW